MRIRRLLVVNIFILYVVTFGQDTFARAPNESLDADLGSTLGFIMGQRAGLNRIKTEYPSLSSRAQIVEFEFQSTFGFAEKNIIKSVKEILQDRYLEYISAVEKQINSTYESQQITQNIALKFLDEVELRAKGEIPSPMLETLLHYQYKERPANEFVRGFTKIYRTLGHRKAKGIDLQVEYPRSWSKREGNRPNVIQFFSSHNGRGPASALLLTKNLVKGLQGELTYEDMEALNTLEGSKELASELFSEISLREMANEAGMFNVRDVNTKRIVIDRWPGAVLEFTGEQHRLDLTITMYSRMYIAIYKKHMIFLQYFIVKLPGETEDELRTKISQFAPLFQVMANSLVIQSQY